MILGPELTEAPILAFSAEARARIGRGQRILSLGLGEPSFPTPPAIVEAAVQALREGRTRYCDALGLRALRTLVAEKLLHENGIATGPERVVVTVGAKQAFLVALQALLEPGDEVVNPTPCFLSFEPAIRLAEPGCIIRDVPLRRDTLTFDMERLCEAINPATRVVVINTPHNPSGALLGREQAEQLVATLMRYPRCHVLSDEIYEYLIWSGGEHVSLGAYPEIADRVFTVNGLSKAFAMTGWRLGYLNVPEAHLPAVAAILKHSNMNVTTFVQHAACAALQMDRAFLHPYLDQLRASAGAIAEALRETAVGWSRPRGSLFGFADVSALGMDSDTFATRLLRDTGVAVNPGIQSGAEWDTHVRISYAGPVSDVQEGAALLRDFVTSRAGRPAVRIGPT